MTLITRDATTVQQLGQAPKAVFLTDGAGKVPGRFVPGEPYASEPPLTEEELQRRAQAPGRSLADILRDLESRA